MRKLAGTSWGARQEVLRTSALALCFSVAEYCAPVWARCAHTDKIDKQLYATMRTISGALKPTPLKWLPTMASIAPRHLRREEATQKQHIRVTRLDSRTPLRSVLDAAPDTRRLRSRKPFYDSLKPDFSLENKWRQEWNDDLPRGGDLVTDPTQPLPGFQTLRRKEWAQANRIRSQCGRTAGNLHRWGYRDSPICPACRAAPQDMDHMILHCPQTAVPGGYPTVHETGQTFCNWIAEQNVEV